MIPIVTFLLNEFAFKNYSQAKNGPLGKLWVKSIEGPFTLGRWESPREYDY